MKPGILKMIRLELAKAVPRFAWGVVTSLTPLTVRLDSHRADAPAIIAGVTNLAGLLALSQRVCIVQVGGRAMALGPPAPPQPPAPPADTGWVNCTYVNSDYTAGTPGQLQVRRIENVVYIRGGAQGPITHATYTPVATIPDGFRPNTILRTGGAAASGRHSLVEITAEGSVNIAWHNYGTTTAAPAWAAVATAYTTD
jgi:hypothetical protein